MSKLNLENYTPHDIVIVHDGVTHTFHSKGIARVSADHSIIGDVFGIPFCSVEYGSVKGLPDPKQGVAYIVSGMVRTALGDIARPDVFAPDTGDTAIRENGKIVAVTRLIGINNPKARNDQ